MESKLKNALCIIPERYPIRTINKNTILRPSTDFAFQHLYIATGQAAPKHSNIKISKILINNIARNSIYSYRLKHEIYTYDA